MGQSFIPTVAFDIFYLHTKFGHSRFSGSAVPKNDMIADIEIENGSYVTLTTPL